ncbi:hypothetical protein CCMSSC00406_0009457 [Pleurotus cornucopiae]|uniref:Uncharacterized protein n=1 Tax=Pleurotus cornucopiae TaxID=5321 RepID=A0ACB7J336_PLECO|nr:hypothetical protein CCMSSC00406_0009457 [Pleurotus cornucopiae]
MRSRICIYFVTYSRKMIFDRKEKPEEATEAPPYNQGPAFRTTFACMSMNSTDLLRLIQFPPEPAHIVRNGESFCTLRLYSFDRIDGLIIDTAITQSWPRGIKEERDYHGAHEFKLKGNPWSGQGSEAVPSRIFMVRRKSHPPLGPAQDSLASLHYNATLTPLSQCQILADLYNAGWVLFASTDISKNALDKDSCLFRYQQPAPPPCSWMSISFNRGDRLRLIGAPQEMIAPFGRVLGPLLQKEGFIEHGAYEFKCKGWPWYAMGGDTVATRILLLRMLELLESFGFSLYASIDQSIGAGGDGTTSETDTCSVSAMMKDMDACLQGCLLGVVIGLSIEVLLAEVHTTNAVARAGVGAAIPACIVGFSTALFSIICVSHITFSHFRSFGGTVVFQTICLPILCVLWFATAALTALMVETLGPERCYSDDLYAICSNLPWIKLCSHINCSIRMPPPSRSPLKLS